MSKRDRRTETQKEGRKDTAVYKRLLALKRNSAGLCIRDGNGSGGKKSFLRVNNWGKSLFFSVGSL